MIKDPWFRNHLIRDAIHRAILEAMRERPEIYCLGEGSHMKHRFDAPKILEEFPERILTMPITEDGNLNFAVGLSLAGLVPIVDVIGADFLFRCADAMCNTAAKLRRIMSPKCVVIRAEYFGDGPTSGQRVGDIFKYVPGLRVVVPQNPIEAYEQMCDTLQRKEVTLFIEERELSDDSFA